MNFSLCADPVAIRDTITLHTFGSLVIFQTDTRLVIVHRDWDEISVRAQSFASYRAKKVKHVQAYEARNPGRRQKAIARKRKRRRSSSTTNIRTARPCAA